MGSISSRILGARYKKIGPTLYGPVKPINSLSFSHNAVMLACAADDGVKIWTTAKWECLLCPRYRSNWGQATCLQWVSVGDKSGLTVVIGTGLGILLVWQYVHGMHQFRELASVSNGKGEAIESLAWDASASRLAVGYRDRGVQGISVWILKPDKSQLQLIWKKELPQSVPKALKWASGQLLVFGLYDGKVSTLHGESGKVLKVLSLPTRIGSVAFTSGRRGVLEYIIDNLEDAVDLYAHGNTEPLRSMPLVSVRDKQVIKQVLYGEEGKIIASGSDHGHIYIWNRPSGSRLQVLQHGNSGTLIQAIATATSSNAHLIASASASENPSIKVWCHTRSVNSIRYGNKSQRPSILDILKALMLVLIFGICLVMLLKLYITRVNIRQVIFEFMDFSKEFVDEASRQRKTEVFGGSLNKRPRNRG